MEIKLYNEERESIKKLKKTLHSLKKN